MSDEIERTLCQLPQVHVFKIPVRKSADGHRASDWPKDPTWTGKVKIVSKGRIAAIILLDDKNQVFAICQVTNDSAVERTLDSGRYYVLRITNAQGRHAFIGIAFNERNDAFDFNVALAEFKSELEREDQAAKMSEVPIGPLRDLSIKDGEKLKIKIALKKTQPGEDGTTSTVFTSKSKGGSFLLPPPKSGMIPQASPVIKQQIKLTNDNDDSWASSDPFQTFSTSSSTSAVDPFAPNDDSNIDPFVSSAFDNKKHADPFGSVLVSNRTTLPAATVGQTQEINLLDL